MVEEGVTALCFTSGIFVPSLFLSFLQPCGFVGYETCTSLS